MSPEDRRIDKPAETSFRIEDPCPVAGYRNELDEEPVRGEQTDDPAGLTLRVRFQKYDARNQVADSDPLEDTGNPPRVQRECSTADQTERESVQKQADRKDDDGATEHMKDELPIAVPCLASPGK